MWLERLRSPDFEGGVELASEGNIPLWSQPYSPRLHPNNYGSGSLHPNPPQPPTKHTVMEAVLGTGRAVPDRSSDKTTRHEMRNVRRSFVPDLIARKLLL